jgi:hypothetical protein
VGPVNVCNEGGSLIIFRDDWAAKNNPAPRSHSSAADAEWTDYCRARERAERAAAKRASSIRARRVHQELAQAYAGVARRRVSE